MPALAPYVGASTVVVSIMAGRTLRFLEQMLPGAAIVRAMPNTPAAIGRGITVAVGNTRVSAPQRELVHALLSAVGAVEWIADEALMDAVTALSGSGPAYVFLLAETMARAGVAAGLPPELAGKLARATVAGSGELLHRSRARRRDPAPECDLAGRHHRRRSGGPDGQGRLRRPADQGDRGRDSAVARIGRLRRKSAIAGLACPRRDHHC